LATCHSENSGKSNLRSAPMFEADCCRRKVN